MIHNVYGYSKYYRIYWLYFLNILQLDFSCSAFIFFTFMF